MNLKLNSLDDKHIVIDIGLTYTKCGYAKESCPQHIIPTQIPLLQILRDNLTEVS